MFIRDEISGKAIAANKDELSKYKAEKAGRRRLSNIEHRLDSIELAVDDINKKMEELLRIVTPNG
jgi:hypothetical protein